MRNIFQITDEYIRELFKTIENTEVVSYVKK